MIYKAEFTKEFLRTVGKLKKKDMNLFSRLQEKIKEILEHPERHKPLKGKLIGLMRAHSIGVFNALYLLTSKDFHGIGSTLRISRSSENLLR